MGETDPNNKQFNCAGWGWWGGLRGYRQDIRISGFLNLLVPQDLLMHLHGQSPDSSYWKVMFTGLQGHCLNVNRLNGSEDYFVRGMYVSHKQHMNVISLFKLNKKRLWHNKKWVFSFIPQSDIFPRDNHF